MAIELTIKLGPAATVKVTGESACEIIEQAAFWAGLPTACPECGAELRLVYRTRQGFKFYGLRCTGPVAHERMFGKHKVDETLFDYQARPFDVALSGQTQDDDEAETPAPAPAATKNAGGRPARAESGAVAPATAAQINAVRKIAAQHDIVVDDIDTFSYEQASNFIREFGGGRRRAAA